MIEKKVRQGEIGLFGGEWKLIIWKECFLTGSLRKTLATGQPMAAGYLYKCNLLKVRAPFLVKAISDSIQTLQSRV